MLLVVKVVNASKGWYEVGIWRIATVPKIHELSTCRHHDLSQPGLRHIAQYAGTPSQCERGARHHRVSQIAPRSDDTSKSAAAYGDRAAALLREKGTPYAELGLGAPHWTDDELIDQMLAHPILINRPIVITPLGVKLCRPSETVLEILPLPQSGRSPRKTVHLLSRLRVSDFFERNRSNHLGTLR